MKERSHESYAKNYSVVYPHDEPLAARNMRRDALYEVRLFLNETLLHPPVYKTHLFAPKLSVKSGGASDTCV